MIIFVEQTVLHEQSSDNAKGLLLLSEGAALGEEGFYWLCLHTANTWGYDKETLDNRVEFTLQNYETFVSYARDPYDNTGWFDADKPFTFLAACYELLLVQDWIDSGRELEEFVSNLPLAIDGVRRR